MADKADLEQAVTISAVVAESLVSARWHCVVFPPPVIFVLEGNFAVIFKGVDNFLLLRRLESQFSACVEHMRWSL